LRRFSVCWRNPLKDTNISEYLLFRRRCGTVNPPRILHEDSLYFLLVCILLVLLLSIIIAVDIQGVGVSRLCLAVPPACSLHWYRTSKSRVCNFCFIPALGGGDRMIPASKYRLCALLSCLRVHVVFLYFPQTQLVIVRGPFPPVLSNSLSTNH